MELTDIPRLIRYGRELANPAIASAREFLIPQGDAFSSSSFAGNTRRYHGLYVNRERIILSSLHETINGISLLPGWWGERSPDDSIRHILSAQMYPVSQEISVGKALVTRTIDLHQGLSIRWEVNGTADMVIRPLMTDRSMHNLNSEHQIEVRPVQGGRLERIPVQMHSPLYRRVSAVSMPGTQRKQTVDMTIRKISSHPDFCRNRNE